MTEIRDRRAQNICNQRVAQEQARFIMQPFGSILERQILAKAWTQRRGSRFSEIGLYFVRGS
jgi:hypothetical protein